MGSGYNLLGIINRLSQFTKTHKQCVDSYVKNYGNEDGTIYYKSNSNEYYHGSNSIFKEIPNNWISGLYTMNNESALF